MTDRLEQVIAGRKPVCARHEAAAAGWQWQGVVRMYDFVWQPNVRARDNVTTLDPQHAKSPMISAPGDLGQTIDLGQPMCSTKVVIASQLER